ncbi:MAG: MATE family efflux transporter [Lachnospiraceae bacterium]|nr:MATE family efflux transporter [Lachnospiraceae bacterium]
MFTDKQLLFLLLPIVAEQLLNSFMGMADSMMVSNIGPEALSAVSLVDSINNLVVQAFSALATGGVIICSNYIGQKNYKHANAAARQLVLVACILSLGVMLPCLLFRMPLLALIFGKVEEGVMTSAGIYFFYTLLSYPGVALTGAGAAIYRAQGNTRTPMWVAILSNVVNVGGNALLIWVFHLGVMGAAIATMFSRFFNAVVLLVLLHREDQLLSVRDYTRIRPDKTKIRAILSMGIPNGIENSMFQFGKPAIQSTVSTLGTAAIAAQAMTNIFENINGIGGVGVGIGLMTIVGQCLGAGRKDEAIYYTKKLFRWGQVVILLSCLGAYAIARPVAFLSGMEAKSAKLFVYMLGWITIVKPILWAPSFIPAYGMRAAGDVRFSMVVSTCTMWLCRVTLSMFLCRVMGFGPMGVWIGMFSDWGIRGVIFMYHFFTKKWLRHHVI